MPDREAKKKTEIKKSAVSAPVEIGKPKEGSEKDIRWYVIHTYSGYENKVKDTLTRKVHSMGMDDTIIQILLPMHDEEEVKDGEKQNAGSIQLTFFDIFSDKTKQFGFKAVFPSGKVLTCLGDEPFNEKCRNFVQNCDYLMCEAFCLYSQKDIFKPYEKFHSTALDAGKLAESLFAKNLILYHTEDETLQTRKKTYTSEARTVFNGNIFVPDDFEVIDLK